MPVGGIVWVDMRGKGYVWEGVWVKDACRVLGQLGEAHPAPSKPF